MVNPKTAKFVLDLVVAVASAAAGVVVKYYIEVPQSYCPVSRYEHSPESNLSRNSISTNWHSRASLISTVSQK